MWLVAIIFAGGAAMVSGAFILRRRLRSAHGYHRHHGLADFLVKNGLGLMALAGFLALIGAVLEPYDPSNYSSAGSVSWHYAPAPDPYEMPTQWH